MMMTGGLGVSDMSVSERSSDTRVYSDCAIIEAIRSSSCYSSSSAGSAPTRHLFTARSSAFCLAWQLGSKAL
jgi:hypothetical protein